MLSIIIIIVLISERMRIIMRNECQVLNSCCPSSCYHASSSSVNYVHFCLTDEPEAGPQSSLTLRIGERSVIHFEFVGTNLPRRNTLPTQGKVSVLTLS